MANPGEVEFSITTNTDPDGTSTIRIVGAFDIYTAPQVRDHLLNGATVEGPVVVDLGGVTFIDSTALGVLVGGHKRATMFHMPYTLVNVPDAVMRHIQATGLTVVFDL